MPLPERYASEVPELTKIWSPEGYFNAQTNIWLAQCEARHEILGSPDITQLRIIHSALMLSPEEIIQLNKAKGHETNKLLRLVQGKLPSSLRNFIHQGNTSSDVLDTSLALQIIGSLNFVKNDFEDIADELLMLALKHETDISIGRSHGQFAIPQTFGRQVAGWYAETLRDLERFDRAKSVIAYGKCSGEVGTNVFISPEVEERSLVHLGLKVDAAPTQVISRDRHAEVLGLMAVNAATLARIATNIRLLAMSDIGEVREPFDEASQQGSSAMPHKRNPELSERICGLARVVYGSAREELDSTTLWLERDISHSSTERFSFPDAFGCLGYAAKLTSEVLGGLVVNIDRMAANVEASYGCIYSPRLLNALMEAGLDRTTAYDLVKPLAHEAYDQKKPLLDLARANETVVELLSPDQLTTLFSPDFYLQNIGTAYKRLGIKST